MISRKNPWNWNRKNNNIKEPFIFIEVPLLFETGFDAYFDYSICVYCNEESRKTRAQKRGDFNLKIYNKTRQNQETCNKFNTHFYTKWFKNNCDNNFDIYINKIDFIFKASRVMFFE